MTSVANIKPLTDFLRNSKSHIEKLRKSREPEILTVNGQAAVVVQDAAAYEEMAARIRQAEDDERLRRALEALREGEENGMPLGDAMAHFRSKYAGKI
ncbi:MAG: type II toxin-antitoxin system Phd/YefM family antitoxin [Akkermansiaceae bacterium]|nr:type II toxin-antitoxin system Phd/YefM family antitoxin [Akkermansiaceae bacterium]